MSRILFAFCALLLSPLAANAQSSHPLAVELGDGSSIYVNSAVCPEGHICIAADTPEQFYELTPDDGTKLMMLPEVTKSMYQARIASGLMDHSQTAAYFTGISDRGILDVCAYCGCCEIENRYGDTTPFQPGFLDQN